MTVSAFDGTSVFLLHVMTSPALEKMHSLAIVWCLLIKKNFRTHRALHLGVHNCEQWYRHLGNPYEVKVDI